MLADNPKRRAITPNRGRRHVFLLLSIVVLVCPSMAIAADILSITKSANPTNPVTGETVVYTITVENVSTTVNATNVVVWDSLPGKDTTTYVDASASDGGNYNNGQNRIDWPSFDLDAEQTKILTFSVTIDAGFHGGTIRNIAKINSFDQSGDDSDLGNNRFTLDTDIQGKSDLSILKSVNEENPVSGQMITYTVTVSNAGPDEVTTLLVNDLLPSGVTYDTENPHSATQGTYTQGDGDWTVGTVASGSNAQLTINATVDPSPSGSIINTATIVSQDQFDPLPDNRSNSATITPGNAADVTIAMARTDGGATNPVTGDDVEYTVTVTNNGPDAATNIIVKDTLPSGLTYSAHTGGDVRQIDGNIVRWKINSLAKETKGIAATQLTLTATVAAGYHNTPISNKVVVDSLDEFDATPFDSAKVSITPQGKSDLTILKSVNEENPVSGQMITYTVTVSNAGPDEVTTLLVNDLLPSGVTYDTENPHSATQGTYTQGDGDWTVGTVASGSNAQLTINATVDPSPSGSIINTATIVSQDQFDPLPDNRSNSATITPGNAADVTIAMARTDGGATNPVTGDDVEYTVTVTNNGPDAATNIIVKDTLPSGLTYSAHTGGDVRQIDGNIVRWKINSLAKETKGIAATQLTLTATVAAGYHNTPISNKVVVDSLDEFDATPSDSAKVSITPQGKSDLTITKTASAGAPVTGVEFFYTVTVSNAAGPDPATNIVVEDILDSKLEFVRVDGPGSYSTSTDDWSGFDVAVGSTAELEIYVKVKPGHNGQQIDNTATITGLDQHDPNTPDAASVPVTPGNGADLAVTVTADRAVYNEDSTVVITLGVTNNGPDEATGVTITDLLPSQLNYVSSTGDGSYAEGTGEWTFSSAIGVSESKQRVINATVNTGAGGVTIENTATATALAETDVDPDNDADTVNFYLNDPPVAICLDNPVFNVDGNCQAVGVTIDNGSNDPDEGAVAPTITLNPAPPYDLGDDQTQVKLTITDEHNAFRECTKTITVQDATKPTFDCPGNMAESNRPDSCHQWVTWSAANVDDNCDNDVDITYSLNDTTVAPPAKLVVGEHIIRVTATDDATNFDSCSFKITVNDTTKPVVTCPEDITEGNSVGSCSKSIAWNIGVSDNCTDSADMTIETKIIGETGTITSPHVFDVGTYNLQVSVKDSSDNETTCAFTVTVNDITDPTVTVSTETYMLDPHVLGLLCGDTLFADELLTALRSARNDIDDFNPQDNCNTVTEFLVDTALDGIYVGGPDVEYEVTYVVEDNATPNKNRITKTVKFSFKNADPYFCAFVKTIVLENDGDDTTLALDDIWCDACDDENLQYGVASCPSQLLCTPKEGDSLTLTRVTGHSTEVTVTLTADDGHGPGDPIGVGIKVSVPQDTCTPQIVEAGTIPVQEEETYAGQITTSNGDCSFRPEANFPGSEMKTRKGGEIEFLEDGNGIRTGEYNYTPPLNFNGEDTISFGACNGLKCTWDLTTFNVSALNDPPENLTFTLDPPSGSVKREGNETITITCSFNDFDNPANNTFDADFKVQLHDSNSPIGLTEQVTYDGQDSSYTARIVWNPVDDITIGKYDLSVTINDGQGGIGASGFAENPNRITVTGEDVVPPVISDGATSASPGITDLERSGSVTISCPFDDDDANVDDAFEVTMSLRREPSSSPITLVPGVSSFPGLEVKENSTGNTDFIATYTFDPMQLPSSVTAGLYDLSCTIEDIDGNSDTDPHDQNLDDLTLFAVALSSEPLDFKAQNKDCGDDETKRSLLTSTPGKLKITNNSIVSIHIDGLEEAGTQNPVYSFVSVGDEALSANGGFHEYDVTCCPTAATTFNRGVEVSYYHNVTGTKVDGTFTLPSNTLTCEGKWAAIEVPETIEFGDGLDAGETHDRNFEVKNTSEVILLVDSPQPGDAVHYSFTPNTDLQIAPSGSVTLTLTLDPDDEAFRRYDDNITTNSNAQSRSENTAISASAQPNDWNVPDAADLKGVIVCGNKSGQFSLQNVNGSQDALRVDGISFLGGLQEMIAVDPNLIGREIGPGDKEFFDITFDPTVTLSEAVAQATLQYTVVRTEEQRNETDDYGTVSAIAPIYERTTPDPDVDSIKIVVDDVKDTFFVVEFENGGTADLTFGDCQLEGNDVSCFSKGSCPTDEVITPGGSGNNPIRIDKNTETAGRCEADLILTSDGFPGSCAGDGGSNVTADTIHLILEIRDTRPPEITPTFTSIDSGSTDQLRGIATDDSGVREVKVRISRLDSPPGQIDETITANLTSQNAKSTEFTATVPRSTHAARGYDYQFEATDINNKTTTETPWYRRDLRFAAGNVQRPTDEATGSVLKNGQWYMIGVPGRPDDSSVRSVLIGGASLSSVTGISDAEDHWRIYRVNSTGAPPGASQQVSDTLAEIFTPGTAYWFRHRPETPESMPWALPSGSYRPSDAEESGDFRINLNNGWTLLSNPYLFEVYIPVDNQNLPEIQGVTVSEFFRGALAGYSNDNDGTTIDPDESSHVGPIDIVSLGNQNYAKLLPWVGYAIRSSGGFLDLDPHPPGDMGTAQPVTPVTHTGPGVNLVLTAGTTPVGGIFCGYGDRAENGWDPSDQPVLPLPRPVGMFYVMHDDWGDFSDRYTIDRRAATAHGAVYPLGWRTYRDAGNGEYRLTVNALDDLPHGQSAYLYDRAADITTALRLGTSYAFSSSLNHDDDRFTLIVGDEEFAREFAGAEHSTRPVSYRLMPNYPNPFNAGTVIEFHLTDYTHVSLEVYNILGQKVRTLADRPMYPGIQRVEFDGTDDSKRSLSTGVYFYRLNTELGSLSRKMVLMK